MTLAAAWVRRNESLSELIIASDSRISGGGDWDVCPKIVALPRPATVMAMSGWAVEAYAFLIQALNTCALLDGHAVGRTDIGNLAKKLRDVYANSRNHLGPLGGGQAPDVPVLDVALLGWSWRNLCFEGYSYSYLDSGELVMKPLAELEADRPYPAYLFGDAAGEARKRLKALRKERGLPVPKRGEPEAPRVAREAFYDWEPFEVLLHVINDEGIPSVGGAPQLACISQYGESQHFVCRDINGTDFFGGRPVQPEERFDRRIAEFKDGRVSFRHSDRSVMFGGDQRVPNAEDR